jgi:hypothetical protein
MKTAKDLAKKAFCDAVKMDREGWFKRFTPKERFESWWDEWYSKNEHKDYFDSELSVFIELKRYIQAE